MRSVIAGTTLEWPCRSTEKYFQTTLGFKYITPRFRMIIDQKPYQLNKTFKMIAFPDFKQNTEDIVALLPLPTIWS